MWGERLTSGLVSVRGSSKCNKLMKTKTHGKCQMFYEKKEKTISCLLTFTPETK